MNEITHPDPQTPEQVYEAVLDFNKSKSTDLDEFERPHVVYSRSQSVGTDLTPEEALAWEKNLPAVKTWPRTLLIKVILVLVTALITVTDKIAALLSKEQESGLSEQESEELASQSLLSGRLVDAIKSHQVKAGRTVDYIEDADRDARAERYADFLSDRFYDHIGENLAEKIDKEVLEAILDDAACSVTERLPDAQIDEIIDEKLAFINDNIPPEYVEARMAATHAIWLYLSMAVDLMNRKPHPREKSLLEDIIFILLANVCLDSQTLRPFWNPYDPHTAYYLYEDDFDFAADLLRTPKNEVVSPEGAVE